jgi:hypothetical protein
VKFDSRINIVTTAPSSLSESTIELPPNYVLAVALIGLALLIAFVQVWVGLAIGLFGLFLLIQTALIRLKFSETALEVYRGSTQIRQFPYQDWQNWQIFWAGLPILFYFREVNSIHFLPILFDPKLLRECLERRCPIPR